MMEYAQQPRKRVKTYNALLDSFQVSLERRQKKKTQSLHPIKPARTKHNHHETLHPIISNQPLAINHDIHESLLPIGNGNEIDTSDDVEGTNRVKTSDISAYERHFVVTKPDGVELLNTSTQKSTKQRHLNKVLGRITTTLLDEQPNDCGKELLRNLKPKLLATLAQDLNSAHDHSVQERLSELQRELVSPILQYRDILYTSRTAQNAQELHFLISLHIANHIIRTRDIILKNNAKLSQASVSSTNFQDQGFTRPKILYILPTKHSCWKMVQSILTFLPMEQQENKGRFEKEFLNLSQNDSITNKPEDFQDLFSGDTDDSFRIGLKFTRKTLKYFSPFYDSDIILASPLGLRMAIGGDSSKPSDHDFLSSIEIVITDQCDALTMQNWEHVEHCFESLNKLPKESHGCDFSRIKPWYLDGKAKYYRQIIILSQFTTPEMISLFRTYSLNRGGSFQCVPVYEGQLASVGVSIPQTFSLIASETPLHDSDEKFQHFTSVILTSFKRQERKGVLLFVPSYLDFVLLRDCLKVQEVEASYISEYTSQSEASRAKSHFLTGRNKMLLYTERAHHFRRGHIPGVTEIIMYGLPNNPVFYGELLQMPLKTVGKGKQAIEDVQVRVLFSKWDALKLERIVGTETMDIIMKDKGNTFKFS